MEPEEHTVKVNGDYISRHSSVTPVQALSELIWNALDADAKNIVVKFHHNDLQILTQIDVTDDGHGMSQSEIIEYFGNLGGSWKREARRTRKLKRPIHGSSGKGRFMVFSICDKAQWNVTCLKNKHFLDCSVSIDGSNCDRFSTYPERQRSLGASGVTVSLTGIKASKDIARLASEFSMQKIVEVFSKYLRTHQDVQIVYDGQTVDYSTMINDEWSFSLPPFEDDDGKTHPMQLDVVEWKFKTKKPILSVQRIGCSTAIGEFAFRYH